MSCNITFRAKVETVYNPDNSIAWKCVKVPKIARRHCDMAAFRKDKRFSGFINSDLFDNLISRQLNIHGIKPYIRLDKIPDSVKVDESGFLAVVTICL